MTKGTLIVGASHAGVVIATTLRELGYDAPITMVGDEPRLPYDRPPLSKAYLLGSVGDDEIQLRSPAFYDEAAIEVVTGQRIDRIDLDASVARSAATDFGFEHLALATGAAPRRLSIPGHDLPGVVYLRTASDAAALGDRLRDAVEVVIVGGGYIGLEAASVISRLGKRVTVVETSSSLIPRARRPEMAQFLAGLHRVHGVTIELGAAVDGFEGSSLGVRSARLSDGRSIPADLVLVGVGIIPNTALALALGLEVDGGIVVDDDARTSEARVVAAGDATAIRSARRPDHGLIRSESVHNASAQGEAAARTILGADAAADQTPWFWSNQFDVKIQMAGHHDASLRSVVRGSIADQAFSILYVSDDGRLRAIDCVNRPGDFLAGRRAIDHDAMVDLERAADPTTSLREAIR